jgi:integrase
MVEALSRKNSISSDEPQALAGHSNSVDPVADRAGKAGLHVACSSLEAAFGEAGSNLGNSDSSQSAGASSQCPSCGSKRIFKDGFRKAPSNSLLNEPVQRYRCADYGHRFSNHTTSLNLYSTSRDLSRISANERAKNLASTQKTKICLESERHTPTENEIKAWLQIEKFLIQLKNDGRKDGTITNYRKSFKRLLKDGADLFDPESTKAALAKSTIKESTKKTVTGILSTWFSYNQINWRVPKYSDEHEVPYIPTETEIDLLIAALGQKQACFCQLLKETGARCGEIAELDWLLIDWEQRKVRIKAEKGSNSRILPLSAKAIEMVSKLRRNNKNKARKNKIFANADDMRSSFYLQKRRIAERQANPKLMLIHFHTFRHWKATMEQHKTKDPWHVKILLGHKSIKSTENYIHLEKMMFDGDANDQFISKVAHNVEEPMLDLTM